MGNYFWMWVFGYLLIGMLLLKSGHLYITLPSVQGAVMILDKEAEHVGNIF